MVSGLHQLLLFPLSMVFSPADPISALLKYREAWIRNGVIMPAVKPLVAQQMGFRGPAFVSVWIRSFPG